jgi:IS30 family transposase
MSQQEMADSVGVSQSAISRELKRNTRGNSYQIKQAQRKAKNRRSEACKVSKMTPSIER